VKILNSQENLSPVISKASVPDSVDITSSREIISVMGFDPDGLSDIVKAVCDIYHPEAPQVPNASIILADNGENGDVISGDGIFSAQLTADFAKKQPGLFSFRFQAFDQKGNASNSLVKVVALFDSNNEPPVISDLVAPDTLKLNPTQVVKFIVSVKAADPQGLENISRVYFNSYKPPDGEPSVSNPFYVNDSGNFSQHGDQVAGDGIYSLRLEMPPSTITGDYRFVFEAVDRSNAISNQIEHIVTVIK
jgi:hypothetical protein